MSTPDESHIEVPRGANAPLHVPATRRSILGAIGALILAAGGSLLPEQQEVASARSGSADGRLGGRRGRNRRGRNKQRERGDARDKRRQSRSASSGPGEFKGIEFNFTNVKSAAPISVDFYEILPSKNSNGGNPSVEKRSSKLVGPGDTVNFKDYSQRAFLWIEGRYFVYANNPGLGWPQVMMGSGGGPRPNSNLWQWGTTSVSASLSEDESSGDMHVDGKTVSARRQSDGSEHKRFAIAYRVD